MNTELLYLTLVTAFTGLLWIPYIIDRIAVRGLINSIGYPVDPKPQSPWAQRLMKAHANAVENLVVFAALVLTADTLNITNETIASACVVYFWVRVAHTVAYTIALPWARTVFFAAGFVAQAVIAWQIIMQ